VLSGVDGYADRGVSVAGGALSEVPSVKKGTQIGPLIYVTGDRERLPLRYLDRLSYVAMLS